MPPIEFSVVGLVCKFAAWLDVDPVQSDRIVDEINAARPHLLVVCLGAPKQEIWLGQYAPRLAVPVAIAAGATIDFLAGVQKRAPIWMQRLRLEWLFRVMSDPKRLAARYARGAIVFPRLVAAEWRRPKAESPQRQCGNSQ